MRQFKLVLLSMIVLSLFFMVGCGSNQKTIEGVSQEFNNDVWQVINITTEELNNFNPKEDTCTVGKGIYPFLKKWEFKIGTPKEQEIYNVIKESHLYVFSKPTKINKDTLEWKLKKFKEQIFKLEKLIQ